MDHDALLPQSILAHQLTPAIVLDSYGTVISANSGCFRLLALSHLTTSSTTQNSLIGTNISDLGLAPLPGGQSPALWSWNELLGAAINCTRSTDSIEPDSLDTCSATAANVEQDTDRFWNKEASKQAVIETDVYVTRQSSEKLGGLQHVSEDVSHDAYESVETSSMIKARANIHWIPQGLDGTFLITLNRASLPYRPQTPGGMYGASTDSFLGPLESTALFSCCSCDKPIEKSYLKLSPDLEGLIPSASDISSSIIPYIMATLNTEGQVINLSKSWYQFSGLDEEESLGNGWLQSMHADDISGVTKSWAEVLQNKGSHWTHQARLRKESDGQYYWFLIRAQAYKNSSGKVVRWYASMMDINEWVMARLESDRNRQAMLALFSQTDVMLWGIDKNVRMYVCEGRLDWDPSKIEKLARTAQTHRTDDDKGHEELILTVQAVLQNKDFRPVIEHWEGHRYFRTRFIAERAEPGGSVKSALALTFDITDEKSRRNLRAENQRLVNNEKVALESNKLKSRFLANITHEVRTPISGIIGLSEHLLECNLSEEQSEFADSILESAKFLLTLINDVLDFSKIESGHMDVETIPFSPSKLINDVIVPLKLQAKEKGLDLNSDCDLPPDEILLGDPWRMRQILTNLVGNSLKFTAQGHVDLSVRTLAQDDPELRSMQFFVRDTGVGIEKEVMKDLFKPFHQADSSTARLHGGTGLGLVICRQLVELMGGHIHLEPNPGGGTTAICSVPFSVYHGPTSDVQASTALPRRAQPPDEIEGSLSLPISPENETHEVEERKRPAGSTDSADAEPDAHVLLVEDNPVNRKVIALAIKKLGYTVSTACDGQEALEYLCRQSQQKQSIKTAVVIMDCQMPNIDGYEATRRIRRDRIMFDDVIRSLPIIALTASAIKGDKEKCWKAGMDDYLTKPAARDALERALFKWTAVKRPTDSDRLDQKPGGGFVDENDQDTKALPKE